MSVFEACSWAIYEPMNAFFYAGNCLRRIDCKNTWCLTTWIINYEKKLLSDMLVELDFRTPNREGVSGKYTLG